MAYSLRIFVNGHAYTESIERFFVSSKRRQSDPSSVVPLKIESKNITLKYYKNTSFISKIYVP